jgi:tetratricopeptide (TPR) repeat protein
VDAVLEPTIMCLGDSVCMQFRLVSTTGEEDQIWVGDYREDKRQILNLFNRITRQVADEVKIELTPEEERLLSISKTVDREAYDEYLKAGRGDFSKESLYKDLEYLNNAVEKDPDWAPLYSSLASVWMGIQQAGYEPTSVTSHEIYKNLNKALELDPNLSEAHASIALIAHWMEWDWEKSEKEFLKALAVNPNDAMSRVLYGQLLCGLQRTDEGIAQGRLAFELDPLNPILKVSYGGILLGAAGDCKTALVLAEEITASDPGHIMANSLIEGAAFQCKEYDKMIKTERYFLPMYDVKEEEIKEIERIFNEQGVVMAYEKIMKHLEEYSENNYISPIDMAVTYMYANQPDKAMDWLEKGFEQHDPKMIYIASIFDFDPLYNNPRFIAICKKMNLPLPED